MEAPSVFFTDFCLSEPRVLQYLTVFLKVSQYFSKLLRRCFPSVKILLKIPWNASKMLPRGIQDGPRGSQDALKMVQEAPKTLQRWPENPPKRSQKPPHGFQDAPRGSQEASRGSKKLPRDSKRIPRGLIEGSKRLANAPSERLGSPYRRRALPKTKPLKNLTFDD